MQFAKSQDYFTRILARLTPAAEKLWDAWLRIIESMAVRLSRHWWAEPVGGDQESFGGFEDDLRGLAYGGDKFKEEFRRLAVKYDVP